MILISIIIYRLTKNCISECFFYFRKKFSDHINFHYSFRRDRLCSLLGTIFGFVGSEISSKMEVLKELKRSDTEDHFSTMKTMVSYERNADLLQDSHYTSGSRTLLRLHRGLGKRNFHFENKFLQRNIPL